MRMRALTAVLAFCLVGLVPLASTSANAAEPAANATQVATAPSAEKAAKPARKVTMKIHRTSRVAFKFTGKVQAAKNKKIKLMYAKKKKGKWTTYRTLRTNSNGYYKTKPTSKKGWYQIKVPGDKRFRTSYSNYMYHIY